MRIVPKLTLSLVAGMCLVLGINGWMRVHRETAAFETERLARHRRAAAAISAAMIEAWRTGGETSALGFMEAVASGLPLLQPRWDPRERHTDGVEPITRIDRSGSPTWYTYVPIFIDGEMRGEVELSEHADTDRENARAILFETTKTAAMLAGLSAVIAFLLGEWVVGKPIRILAAKARRIGRGDLSAPVELHTTDELAQLAHEMNAMCDRLVMTMAQLRHADRLATVGKLAAGVAHELGTPLNVVSARAEMLAAGRASPEQVPEFALSIGTAAARMTRIIGQLLQFARRKGVQRAVEDVDDVIREAVDLLRPLARKRRIDIELELETLRASVDRGQLQQVITNLVMNAVHASPEGTRVDVRLARCIESPPADVGGDANDGISIVVEDRGEGIKPEDRSHIFEPFFTTKDVGEGTGLGLAVTYGIVREHNGWINVESELGRGSRFTVVLPVGASE
jgi:signal transduction histidine kinase